MALKVSKKAQSGAVGSYLKIHSLQIVKNQMNVGVQLFLSEAERHDGSDPLETVYYPAIEVAQEEWVKHPVSVAYDQIKSLFEGAEDC